MFIASFLIMLVTGVNLPPRYYYPEFNLTSVVRERCNQAADDAYEASLLKDSDKGFARFAEVDAFEACAKAAS